MIIYLIGVAPGGGIVIDSQIAGEYQTEAQCEMALSHIQLPNANADIQLYNGFSSRIFCFPSKIGGVKSAGTKKTSNIASP